jgi:hypothetical protein
VSIVCGVDPGLSGAICVLTDDPPRFVSMPVTEEKRPDYNLFSLYKLLLEFQHAGLSRLFVERPQPLPPKMGGSLANFHRGYSLGMWASLCYALSVPVEFVPPQRWQKAMLEGCSGDTTKARALQAASRLFPGLDMRRTPKCRKPDGGYVDSLLIAEYGRRKLSKEG